MLFYSIWFQDDATFYCSKSNRIQLVLWLTYFYTATQSSSVLSDAEQMVTLSPDSSYDRAVAFEQHISIPA